MNILFIGKRFYTGRDALLEKYGRIYQLPWHWAQEGHATQLWLVDYHSRESVRDRDGTLEIASTPVRTLEVLRHWRDISRRRTQRIDWVVASGDCYIGWMGQQVARQLRARFALDVYDKYDEFGGYIRPLGMDLFGKLVRQADLRLFASRALMQSMQQSENDWLVPNGLDTERFRPADMASSRLAMGLPADDLLIGYFGGMEPDRGTADLIEAVGRLRHRGLRIQLVLGGRVPKDLDVNRSGVLYLGNVDYAKMPMALAACDLLSVPYRRSAFMDAGASNKIAEAIACRRPVVATRTPNLLANFPAQARQLESLLCEPGDVEGLARSIQMQAEQRLLVDLPPGMTWADISQGLAHQLAQCAAGGKPRIHHDKEAA